jgi:hypothetical protein
MSPRSELRSFTLSRPKTSAEQNWALLWRKASETAGTAARDVRRREMRERYTFLNLFYKRRQNTQDVESWKLPKVGKTSICTDCTYSRRIKTADSMPPLRLPKATANQPILMEWADETNPVVGKFI